MAGILFAGTALAGYVRESFDGSNDGTAVSNLTGWTASDSSVKVTNVGVVAHSTNNVLVVPIGKIVTNTVGVSAGVSNVVWTDFWTVPRPIGEVPDVDTNATAQFFLSNGYWVVFSGAGGSTTNAYTVTNLYNTSIVPVLNTGTNWYHVSVCQNYSNKLWHLFVDGEPIATNLGFINQSVSNYEWFVVQNRDSDSSSNMTLLDDVLITNAVPSSLTNDLAGGSANGLRDAWELMYYGHLYSGIDSASSAVVRADGWTLAQLGSVGAPPVNPPVLVEYLFGGSTQSILSATASNNNIRLTLATVPDRTNTVLRTTDPNVAFSSMTPFYTGASGESNSWTDAPGTLTNGGRVFYRVVSSVPGTSLIRTNDQIFALYQQARQLVGYYAVGIPVDYGASNKLNSTLGHDLATGLRGDNSDLIADTIQLYNPITNFYLKPDGKWWDGAAEATVAIEAGRGFLIRTRGLGVLVSGYTNAVFSGNKVTNTSKTVTLAGPSWHMLSWPFDNTTVNWTNALNPAGHGTGIVANADAIWLLENNRFTARMILKTNGWYYDFPNGGAKVTNVTFNPGQGFFYHNKGGAFNWDAVAP